MGAKRMSSSAVLSACENAKKIKDGCMVRDRVIGPII
jgi:hypothetical protein